MINLFDFTYCGDYNRQIQNLARMVPEKWSFSDTDDNGILKGYLEHTFKRLYEEQKVWEKKNYAIFNTGLFNYYYQPIYAYFIPNLVPDRQPWFLDGFYTEYYLLKEGITCLPEKACYVENPSDLVFDTKLPVIPQYEHIFGDEENAARLPKEVRDSSMKMQLFDGARKQTNSTAAPNLSPPSGKTRPCTGVYENFGRKQISGAYLPDSQNGLS